MNSLHMRRMAELNRKRELNAAAELKRAEIILAKRYAHQAMLAKFLRTAAQPRLLWAPAKHCADTILLEEQRQLELAVWMVCNTPCCIHTWREAPLPLKICQRAEHRCPDACVPSIVSSMVQSSEGFTE